jgi:hypothetical protein
VSRTDKDRPYLVRLYDKSNNAPRLAWHTCGQNWRLNWRDLYRHTECDYGTWNLREHQEAWNRRSTRLGPLCTDVLNEDPNRSWSRDTKVRIRRIKRRSANAWCRALVYDPEAPEPELSRYLYGMYAHKS